MAEERASSQERTEKATPQQRQRARDEGRIARSPELSAAVVLLGGTLALAIVGLVQEDDGREHAVGVARFGRATAADTEAEVAVVVRDDFQRKGLGKHLLLTLADKARELGISYFTAWVASDNIRLMKLIKDMELRNVQSETRHGQTKIRVPL